MSTKETETPTDRPVLRAIADIMANVGSVEKRGRNDFHKYDYATAADIAHALQKRMAEAGLIIIPNQTKFELMCEDNLLAVEFEFMVEHVSGDKLDDRPRFTGVAAARNSKGGYDDKAANKCLTAASKYFVLNLFRIPTGEYHDADEAEDRPAQKSAYRARKDGDWDALKREMVDITTPDALKEWGIANSERIHALPNNWQTHFRELYEDRMTELRAMHPAMEPAA